MDNNLCDNNKKELRKEYKMLRNQMDLTNVEKKSKLIVEKVIDSDFFVKAKNIMVYVPYKNEVDIRKVFEIAWERRKQILVPKTDSLTKKMEPYVIKSWDELIIGNYNIYEPNNNKKKPFLIDKIDVILVPGIIFARDGYRIGYGGGYYDRFFERFKDLPLIVGIAYDFQILDFLPNDNYDYPVSEIITDEQVIFCS